MVFLDMALLVQASIGYSQRFQQIEALEFRPIRRSSVLTLLVLVAGLIGALSRSLEDLCWR
jgi:hypothetical protein